MFKKKIALILVVIMLGTLLPVLGLAQGLPVGPDALGTNTNVATDTDIVVYNLLNQEITVGRNEIKAADTPWAYKLFDENGDYTIDLESNAFFPYEVQFQHNGKTTTEWFETPDSAIEIGGHTFTIRSEMNDPNLLMQIGVYIGGEYVAARPEPKSFKPEPGFTTFSLLPLTTKMVSLDLRGKLPVELSNVNLSAVISGVTPIQSIDPSAQVVWAKKSYATGYDDNYKVITDQASAILDLSPLYTSSSNMGLELIVGTASQFDNANVRYLVSIEVSPPDKILSFSAATQEGIQRTSKTIYSSYLNHYNAENSHPDYWRHSVAVDAPFENGQEAYIGLNWDSSFSSTGLTVKIYSGWYDTAADAQNAATADPLLDLTGTIWNSAMSTLDAGHKDDYTNYGSLPRFTVVYERGEQVVETARIEVYIYERANSFSYRLYTEDYGVRSSAIRAYSTTYTNDGIISMVGELYDGFPASEEYYLTMDYYYQGNYNNAQTRQHIVKAVVGHFDTLAEASGQADITVDLFPDSSSNSGTGYKACYGGDGVKFTIFDDDNGVHKITYKAVDGPVAPLSGDTYFEVTGSAELTDVYVMPYQHDSYYRLGYQTVFTTDENVPLSNITPTFRKGGNVNIFAGNPTTMQTSNVNQHDFSTGSVQYSASAQDGEHLKNYWVTFVKKHTGGSKLFINGINGPDGAEREIFLNSAYDNIHDIFIANVGDTPLTGITVTLNATNVKLDDYWTAANNTLAAFTTTDTPSGYPVYVMNQLPNVAKIRLLPDGNGEISGTLTITADGQAPVKITLKGSAGDPQLVTTTLKDAVKYVPYAAMIQHTNKFDWNRVSFGITSGALPAGMRLKPNGEIYGAPLETGIFTFTIRMSNSHNSFSDSTATYTLVVKENTNSNVDGETDAGYDVTVRVPDTIYNYQDRIFTSDGAFSEFIDFWLDGQPLTRGVDYSVVSGSTKITVYAQTFQNAGTGTHTIAAEFRVDGDKDKELKRAAQNYTLEINPENPDYQDNDGDGSSGSDGNSGGTAGLSTRSPSGGAASSFGASGSISSALFSKNPSSPDYKDVVFYLDLNGSLLSNISNGGSTLQYGTDFISSGITFTIKKEYLLTLGFGVQTLQFNLDNGTAVELSIAIVETGNGIVYSLLSGFDNYTGSGEVSARIDAEFSSFTQLISKGAPLLPGNYSVKSGSTIITLNQDYLNTLAEGLYIYRAEFVDGYADLILEVRRQSVVRIASSAPQTGDMENEMTAWLIMLTVSFIGIASAMIWRRRLRASGRW